MEARVLSFVPMCYEFRYRVCCVVTTTKASAFARFKNTNCGECVCHVMLRNATIFVINRPETDFACDSRCRSTFLCLFGMLPLKKYSH